MAPAVSVTECVPVATSTAGVAPPSAISSALTWPSTSRSKRPASVVPAIGTTSLTTLMVPLSRVLVTKHTTHSRKLTL